MPGKLIAAGWLFWLFPARYAAALVADLPKQPARTVNAGDMLHWGLALLIVLAIFLLCVWGLRKLNVANLSGTDKMRIVGGLSLGMREKVVLLQVGRKQLVLGVTPGQIQALHVLEGEDCLCNTEKPATMAQDAGFAQKLMDVMKRRSDV